MIAATFTLVLLLALGAGVLSRRGSKKEISDYLVGGRSFGPVLVSSWEQVRPTASVRSLDSPAVCTPTGQATASGSSDISCLPIRSDTSLRPTSGGQASGTTR